jgi:hypothetical protein
LAFGRSLWTLRLAPLVGSLLLALPAPAQSVRENEPETPDAATLDARRHFKAGTKLYRDGNYGGALAEFEEAYRLKPGPGSLQNVALSQKGLFRYFEAAESLELLLTRHGAELSDGEQRAVADALSELRGLVVTVRVRVLPAGARVVMDGRVLSEQELAAPLVLNVGEHTFSADAAGYAPEKRVLRLAGGQRDVPVELTLRCTSGFVHVTSNDPTANIAIDGLPKARRVFTGPVEPGTEHLLQVYREGVETYEQTFEVGLCETLRLHAELEGLDAAPAAAPVDPRLPLPEAPQRRTQKGWFGFVTLDLLGVTRKPLALDYSSARGGRVGALGVRAGYRLPGPLAFALRGDVSSLRVEGARDAGDQVRDFSLSSIHLGPELKLMTGGDNLRFVATVGAGLVQHRLALSPEESHGLDPYFALELAFGFNYRHVLGELSLVTQLDGISSLQGGLSEDINQHLTKSLGATLPMIGIGLRAGFSQWRGR